VIAYLKAGESDRETQVSKERPEPPTQGRRLRQRGGETQILRSGVLPETPLYEFIEVDLD
jgi:hypothetical protein